MTIPNELWYALGGLILAWIAQWLKLPSPVRIQKPDDIRSSVREILLDFLKPPMPASRNAVDDDELRRRVLEIIRESGPSAPMRGGGSV
jgi:hypothetical protein